MYIAFFETNNYFNFNFIKININNIFIFFLTLLFFNVMTGILINLKYEKNIDVYSDVKKYMYIYLSLLNINIIYFFLFNSKVNVFFFLTFFHFLTTFVLITKYILIDPLKFTLVLSGFSNKNWLKNTID